MRLLEEKKKTPDPFWLKPIKTPLDSLCPMAQFASQDSSEEMNKLVFLKEMAGEERTQKIIGELFFVARFVFLTNICH